MPQYVVIRSTTGQLPGDGEVGSGDIFVVTQADESSAAQFVADQLNVKSGDHLYTTSSDNFVDSIVSRTVT